MLRWGADPFYSNQPMDNHFRSFLAGQVPKELSRLQASKWAQSAAAAEAGVVVEQIHPYEWYLHLSRFRFMVSPMGDEIQSPKVVEAMLVLTVPIVQRGPYTVNDDLARMGFPLVVVDEWWEVTAERLRDWWQALSPRLVSFRANC